MLPTLPGVFLTLEPLDADSWASAVPVLGQQVLLLGVLRGDSLPVLSVVASTGIIAALTLGCIYATTRLFARESTIFGD